MVTDSVMLHIYIHIQTPLHTSIHDQLHAYIHAYGIYLLNRYNKIPIHYGIPLISEFLNVIEFYFSYVILLW